jgi:CheY-like chemotaxis protein
VGKQLACPGDNQKQQSTILSSITITLPVVDDLMLLDLNLPDVNGIHFCQRLHELFPSLPTVVCTVEAEPDMVGQLATLTVQHYLQKPITGEKLLATV